MKTFDIVAVFASARLVIADFIAVPPIPATGPSVVQWTAGKNGFDAPKVVPINSTTFDWWYFDAVSFPTGGQNLTSVQVVFYTATFNAFDPLRIVLPFDSPSVNLIQVTVSLQNGTVFNTFLNETQAHFLTIGDGVNGLYDTGDAMFSGTTDMSHFSLHITAPESGITGFFDLVASSPPHGPCSPVSPKVDLQVAPHIGWANAVPDGKARVAFQVLGEDFALTGRGYHDKHWGDQEINQSAASWYWGHAHVGSYTLVWLTILSRDGNEYVSSYIASNTKIITAQCSGIKVRPFGPGTRYPPHMYDPMPNGFRISADLPGQKMYMTATAQNTMMGHNGSPHHRWVGTIEGGMNGETISGVAIFEQFVYDL